MSPGQARLLITTSLLINCQNGVFRCWIRTINSNLFVYVISPSVWSQPTTTLLIDVLASSLIHIILSCPPLHTALRVVSVHSGLIMII
jgi:hypothetical protein